ncbi:MAG: class I SAM-dependent methyltransferase [Bavariicoccus seileri]|uniref:Methyltransferase domain-containing protein n=1 Tax=Bavariicoccus seileri TaxID=549685 RepID=A0A3D4S4X6_9ENTE|nr:class I SAM-dependent methyltransferase [Bavariicoccus seileri]HCS93638.1 methyltransferase domain-containing protein [Bavariicoccus seileri]
MKKINPLSLSHLILKNQIKPGDTVVDATVGNGHDTLFLAQLVKTGKVIGFDIQENALKKAQALLDENLRDASNVHLIQSSHENISDYIKTEITAVIYNLGYLPGGDHSIITKFEPLVRSLISAIQLLKPKGIVSIMSYRGHTGNEYSQLLSYVTHLKQDQIDVYQVSALNQKGLPAELFILQKK